MTEISTLRKWWPVSHLPKPTVLPGLGGRRESSRIVDGATIAAQIGLTLAERTSNTESGPPREGSPVAKLGTRFVTRCGTLATQMPEEEEI
jgi:hypothetical protein